MGQEIATNVYDALVKLNKAIDVARHMGQGGLITLLENQKKNIIDRVTEYYHRWPSDAELKDIPLTIKKSRSGFLGTVIGGLTDLVQKITVLPLKLAVLAPFKKAMTAELDRRKIPYSKKKIMDVADKFFNKVIKKQNFELIEPVSITVLISTILSFFKAISQNPKDIDEQNMADIAERDAANADALVKEEEARLAAENNKNEGKANGGISLNLGFIIGIIFLVFVGRMVMKGR